LTEIFIGFLSVAGGCNELGSNPFRFADARLFCRLRDFLILRWRDPRGNKFALLFIFGKHRPANLASRFAHGFLSFFGNGVFSNAFNPSLKSTPYKFGSMTSLAGFVFCFDRFDTDSLYGPRYVRLFWFHQTVIFSMMLVPSIRLPIRQTLASDHSKRGFHPLQESPCTRTRHSWRVTQRCAYLSRPW
jgi:hypothetical protein